MNSTLKLGLAVLAVGLSTISAPAFADGMHSRGGAKDAPAPEGRARSCYFRGDVGYAWTENDKGYSEAAGPFGIVQDANFDDTWFGEVGVGCGWNGTSMVGGSLKDAPVMVAGPGIRVDVTVGYRGEREYHGVPPIPPAGPVDPVSAKLSSVTLMFNGYLDFKPVHGWTPYLGAGIGLAFNEIDDVTFTNGVVVRIGSKRETDFAWALMAGASRDLGRGILLDIGYRYIDLGDISIAGVNGAGQAFTLRLDDLTAHEARVGLRIPFSH